MIIPALGISLLSFGQLETLTPKEQAYKDSIAKLNQQNAAVAASQEAYNRGVTQFSGKNYAAAIAEFQKSINSDPNFTAAYYNKGLTEKEAVIVNGLQRARSGAPVNPKPAPNTAATATTETEQPELAETTTGA